MKRWLVRLYPRPWQERYGEEFHAVVDQQALTLSDMLDIVRGACDAHWTALAHPPTDQRMRRPTPHRHRRIAHLLLGLVLVYTLSYTTARATGILVHEAGNRFTSRSAHAVFDSYNYDLYNPYPTALELVYWPLRLLESVTWPLVDRVYQPTGCPASQRPPVPSCLYYPN